MKYKLFPTPVFNHFIQPSPPIAKLKSLHGVLRGQIPHENGSIPLRLAPHMKTSKSPPKSYKYNHYHKTTYKVPPTARFPRQT